MAYDIVVVTYDVVVIIDLRRSYDIVCGLRYSMWQESRCLWSCKVLWEEKLHLVLRRMRLMDSLLWSSTSCRDALRADSDTPDRLQPTPSEGRQSWHFDTPSSPHLPPDPVTISHDYGPEPQDLRAGWTSGRTKPEYTAAGTTRPRDLLVTYQFDARDSKPNYSLCPTRPGPDTMLEYSVSPFTRSAF
jgi:hypothetical protein